MVTIQAEEEVERLRAALAKLQDALHETFCAPDWPDDEWCEFVRLTLGGRTPHVVRESHVVQLRSLREAMGHIADILAPPVGEVGANAAWRIANAYLKRERGSG